MKEKRFAWRRETEHKRQLCKYDAREKGPSTLGIEMVEVKTSCELFAAL